MVLSGGGALLPGSVELAKRVLGIRVRLGSPQGFGGLTDNVNTPVYATGVGLVQYGVATDLASSQDRSKGGFIGSFFGRIFKTLFRWLGG